MAKYLKSHSNFVLKERHQDTSKGTIFERDITTIGGRDYFTNGQVPVYRSGNFVITVNDDPNLYSKRKLSSWHSNDNGEVWTSKILSNHIKDEKSSNEKTLSIKPDYKDIRDYAYFGSCSELIRSSINDILSTYPGELYRPTSADTIGGGNGISVYYKDVSGHTFYPTDVAQEDSEDRLLGEENYYLLDNPFGINIYDETVPIGENPLKYFANGGVDNYVAYINENGEWDFSKPYKITITERNISGGTCPGEPLGYIKMNFEYLNANLDNECICDTDGKMNLQYSAISDVTIFIYVGNDGEKVYLVEPKDYEFRIRPNNDVFMTYINSLDSFERLLLNTSSNPIYTAYFELIGENEYGYYTYTDKFTFPTTYGGYNIGSNGNPQFNKYLSDLVATGEFYDERMSDNIFRSLTHESIKNLDFTRPRNDEGITEEEYEGEGRITKMLRLYGREFDEIKLYIDAIKDVNRVTYDEVNNLPDYFLTDELEKDGWDVKPIYPLRKTSKCTPSCVNDNALVVMPYPIQPKRYRGLDVKIGNNSYVCDEPVNLKVKTVDASCCLPTRLYGDDVYYNMHDVNLEFMKRFVLNSKGIIKHKGTIDGIEMMLSLFGLRSKRNVISDERSFYLSGNVMSSTSMMRPNCQYDYDIKEYSVSGGTLFDNFDNNINDYAIDHANKYKQISYPTDNYRNGIYVEYQGLPVKMEEQTASGRTLCPWFDKNASYDGNPYYQMNGGWLSKWSGGTPCMFNSNGDLVVGSDKNYVFFGETSRNVKAVETIADLVRDSSLGRNSGDICQVIDTESKEYALLDGIPYLLYTDGNGNKYVSITSSNGAMTVANKTFMGVVSLMNSSGGYDSINLDSNKYSNGSYRLYVKDNVSGVVFSNEESVSTCEIFSGNKDGYTKYFRINKPEFYYEISEYGWQQISKDDPIISNLEEIKDYFKGNNPHNGNMNYDNGHEYFTHFAKLLKYADDNGLINYGRYDGNYTVFESGFTGIIDDDFCQKNYEDKLISDSKCHHLTDGETGYRFNTLDVEKGNGFSFDVNSASTGDKIYGGDTIMNTKVMDIIFKTNNDVDYARYIDKIIVPYLSQMIPSTSICRINYE